MTRVTDAFDINGLGFAVQVWDKVFGLITVYETDLDTQSRESDFELVVGAAVEVGCRDNIVTG